MALLGPADMKKMVPLVLMVIAVVLYFAAQLQGCRGNIAERFYKLDLGIRTDVCTQCPYILGLDNDTGNAHCNRGSLWYLFLQPSEPVLPE
jgi:hypothetical protein